MDGRDRIPAVVGGRDAWPPVVATFMCDRCGGVACTLAVLPPYVPDPAERLTPAGGAGAPFQDAVRLSIDGPVQITHTFLPGMQVDLSSLEAAIGTRDASRIFKLDGEYAPFWCPTCSKSYCRTCWVVWVEYDEVFYDCTRGLCPEGHRRIMDD